MNANVLIWLSVRDVLNTWAKWICQVHNNLYSLINTKLNTIKCIDWARCNFGESCEYEKMVKDTYKYCLCAYKLTDYNSSMNYFLYFHHNNYVLSKLIN